ncbi:hypothetical protein Bca52824_074110 [Brassica carinata]|uniref:Uncharacterized protein n=1 Tax=Brassica carinata TaxID=52824 RepID=A0A8X7U7D5_BRACI|nr:hypothetical protein Bca52824_074110 [Brassica carinata]
MAIRFCLSFLRVLQAAAAQSGMWRVDNIHMGDRNLWWPALTSIGRRVTDGVLITNLKEEIINKVKDHDSILEERNGLSEKIKGLEVEIETLRKQRSELDEELRTKTENIVQMRDKINETSAETVALTEQINNLQHELDSLQVKKSETEAELIERSKRNQICLISSLMSKEHW